MRRNGLKQFRNLNNLNRCSEFLSDGCRYWKKDRIRRSLQGQLDFEALRLQNGVITRTI